MAITTVQEPVTFPSASFIHGSTYPAFYTAISDNYAITNGFKYAFNLNTSDGLVDSVKNAPRTNNGIGIYDSVPVTNSLVSSTFQPTIQGWTICPDSIRQYRVDVSEYYNGETQLSTIKNYQKTLLIKNNKENFVIQNYILNNSNAKMLTERTETVDVRLTDYATLRFLNASIYNTNNPTYISQPYSILFQFFLKDGGSLIYSYHIPNPYWYTTISMNTGNTVFDDHSKIIAPRLLEFPVAPANFTNSMYLDLIWVIGSEGTAIPISPPYSTPAKTVFEMSDIDYYDVWAYTYPNGDMSQKYRYKIVCENSVKAGIQLQWANTCGGVDCFLFSGENTKTNKIATSTYLKNKYQLGHVSMYSGSKNNWIGSTGYDRGITQIFSEQNTTYTLFTKYITQAQREDLTSLWQSNDIYANIGGTFYPVISLTEAIEVDTTKQGLKQYAIDIQIANNKYNL